MAGGGELLTNHLLYSKRFEQETGDTLVIVPGLYADRFSFFESYGLVSFTAFTNEGISYWRYPLMPKAPDLIINFDIPIYTICKTNEHIAVRSENDKIYILDMRQYGKPVVVDTILTSGEFMAVYNNLLVTNSINVEGYVKNWNKYHKVFFQELRNPRPTSGRFDLKNPFYFSLVEVDHNLFLQILDLSKYGN